ncbi:MAG: 30S ribosomal protein S16 [Gemmatales bacterium]|nr:30S ribosomal protein S16 [Gemmatales bacterium]MDW8222026.1 30S ribosomal protein S16 [Gemmatales bacterium]
MVRIRLKKMGRKHRSFFRIVATDARMPRDGRVIEELGTYDPLVQEDAKKVTLKPERVRYWLSVGAQPTEKVKVLLEKYLPQYDKPKSSDSPVVNA